MKSKHVVNYMGNGIWRDNKAEAWGADSGEIKRAREFESEMTEEQFLESRQDIKFMVEYKQMSINTISLDEVPPVDPPVDEVPPVNPPADEIPPVNPPADEVPPVEVLPTPSVTVQPGVTVIGIK